ncbi:MAG: hypothetical protein ACR2G2_01500 [Pseudonocardia sp.]
MTQHTTRPSSLDGLGLAAWGPSKCPAPAATLGSLSDLLGDFLADPAPRVVVPTQRTATLLEARR